MSPAATAPPVVLVAHGSTDPRAAATTRALARRVAAARPGRTVRTAYLDHAGPRLGEVLFALDAAGHTSAVVVPLLLTAGYHGRVDLPALLAAARADGLTLAATVSQTLGGGRGEPPPLLLAALRRRLAETGVGFDAVVLAAAGTRDDAARATVDLAAARLGSALGGALGVARGATLGAGAGGALPCIAAFASGPGLTVGAAVTALRSAGASRIAIGAYFLACGRLYDTVMASAVAAGAVTTARPLGDVPELAQLVLTRVDNSGDKAQRPHGVTVGALRCQLAVY